MKKTITILLALLMALSILTSCGTVPLTPDPQPAPPAEQTPDTPAPSEPQPEPKPEPEPAPEPEYLLLEQAEPLDGAGILWRVPCDTQEELQFREMGLWQDFLVLSGPLLPADPAAADASVSLQLALLDLHTGDLLYKTALEGVTDYQIWYCEDTIAVTDWVGQTIYLLDETLTVTQKYNEEMRYFGSYLSKDASTLFSMTEEGFLRKDLATGQTETLQPRLRNVLVSGTCGDTVAFSGIDPDSLMAVRGALDLAAMEIRLLPFDNACYSLSACEEYWLGSVADMDNVYRIGTEADSLCLQLDSGSADLLPCGDRMRLLTRRGNAEGDLFLSVYDTDGTFVSSAAHPMFRFAYIGTPIYCEAYNGCFFPVMDYDGNTVPVFWDLSVPMLGEDLPAAELPSDPPEPGTAVSAALYERAADLSDRFGVRIRIADQCDTDYYTYTVAPEYDEEAIRTGLTLLEETLSQYPDGFLAQLRYDTFRFIEINLMGALTPKDLPENANGFTGFVAFVEEHDGKSVMVLDLTYGLSLKQHIYHEFSHIIDGRLQFEANLREGALYSEETWAAMNPEGFDYQWDYHTVDDSIWRDGYDAWFIDAYSRTFPTEDRARILEYAMFGLHYPFTEGSPLRDKLAYYSACIRDSFDTAGWLEMTLWEKPLYQ